MALIKCPNCGNDVSDKAFECPQCGKKLREKEIPTVLLNQNRINLTL